MLKMGRSRPINCHDRPTDWHGPRPGPADIHHRLNGNGEPGNELGSAPRLAVVRHLGLLVERHPDTVAHEITHDAEARFLDYGLDRGTDVANVIAGPRRINTRLERPLRHVQQ